MELKKILDVRRSTRKFLEQPVEQQKLERVCQMALQAPSSRNSRSTRFMIVTDKEKLEALAKMRDYGSAFMKNATAAIIVMGDAAGVRRETGEQAKILNRITRDMFKHLSPEEVNRNLKELVGHTPLQVFVGFLLGFAVPLLMGLIPVYGIYL